MSAGTRGGVANRGVRLRQELHLLRREGLAPWALVALTLLLVAAALNGRALLGVQARTAATLEDEVGQTTRALADQAGRGVATAVSPGVVGYSVLSEPAVLPPAPLGALAIGQGDLLPSWYPVTARGAHTFLARSEPENPLRLSIGNFDAAFVVVWLLPLIVIALSFNLVSAERERGVLAVAVAAGASPVDFILGKVAARALIVFGSLWLALLAAALAAGVPLGRAAGTLPLLLWLAGATLYAAFWFALALFVNSRPRASDQNASLLAGAWLVLVILLPALTNLAATTVFAAPSRVALTTELREASEQADRAAAATRDQYFFDHPEMQGGEMDRTAYFQSVAQTELGVSQAMAPLLAEFEVQARRQQGLVEVLQFLSPGTMTWQSLTALAGSDGARHREFRAQTLAFHDRWSAFFREPLMRGATLRPADYAALPQFRFEEPLLGRTLARALPALAVLLALSLLLGGIAIRRLRRFPVV
jgi:ABC-2 type transport system permease protein